MIDEPEWPWYPSSDPPVMYRRTRPERPKRRPERAKRKGHRMEEPECCKCEATRAPIRTCDVSKPNGFSTWSLFLSIMMTGLMFGLLLELVS